MKYRDGTKKLAAIRGKIAALRSEMRKTQAQLKPEVVADHVFRTDEGEVSLSELFGTKAQLFVIHNMGAGCSYCTLWADGYNGLYEHLADRAAFVVASPDAPAKQSKFATSRGWRFPMISDGGAAFACLMGYASEDGKPKPGISVFQKTGKRIVRVSDTAGGPYDDFCAAWHLFDMLPEGAKSWQPKLKYARETAA